MWYQCNTVVKISIHALLAESDATSPHPALAAQPFLSTLSLRRATIGPQVIADRVGNFYPRSPCGERPFSLFMGLLVALYFYPRSPCGERPLWLTATRST